MSHVAVTAIGPDRPGIVAGLTQALYELGCNLEDATSTVLRGHFAIVLIVAVPDDVDQHKLDERLRQAADDLRVIVTAREVEDLHAPRPPASHLVSVYGADRPGIVSDVTGLLSERGLNILDLNSRVVDEGSRPTYVLMLEIAGEAAEEIADALSELGDKLGVDVSIHPIETEIF